MAKGTVRRIFFNFLFIFIFLSSWFLSLPSTFPRSFFTLLFLFGIQSMKMQLSVYNLVLLINIDAHEKKDEYVLFCIWFELWNCIIISYISNDDFYDFLPKKRFREKIPQVTFTCSEEAIETLQKGVIYV